MRTGWLRSMTAAATIAAAMAPGCAGGWRAPTTRLQTDDFRVMTTELAAGLAASEVLRGRTAESPAMTIAMDRVENLTSDIITEGEAWMLMDRVRNAQDLVSLSAERNVRFVIPALRAAQAREGEPDAYAARAPTHAMRATIRSLTRQAMAARTEVYDIEYRLVDIATGDTVWTGTYALKRAAVGREWD